VSATGTGPSHRVNSTDIDGLLLDAPGLEREQNRPQFGVRLSSEEACGITYERLTREGGLDRDSMKGRNGAALGAVRTGPRGGSR